MKKPWDTWVLKGLSINEAAPLFEKMERIQMEPWGHAFGWKNLTLADGRKVKLTIQKNGLVPVYIAIATGGELPYCVSTSGLYSVSHFLYGDIFLPYPAPNGTTEHYAFLPSSSYNGSIARPFTASAQFSDQFLTEGSPPRYPNSLVIKKAGVFTGEMKRVVQLLAGRNAEIPYGYQWAKTHGIFINSQTGVRWVIEIEQNGVTAWPLEVEQFACTGALVNYLPVPVTDLDTVTGKITIMPSEELAPAYVGGPLLGGYMSWAFSASGHEAQVVSTRPTDSDYGESVRWRLDFIPDGNGNPASATLTEVESGIVWTRNIGQNVRCPPGITECGPSHPLMLFSYDPVEPPEERVFSFPLTVYYIGDTEQPFTYNNKPWAVDESIPATPGVPTMDPLDCASFLYTDDWMGVDIYSARTTTRGNATISGIPWAETSNDASYNVAEYTHTRFELSDTGGPGCCTVGTGVVDSPWGIYGSNHKITKTAIRYPTHDRLYEFCLIFPWWEREAFLFQERWIESQDDPVIEYTSSRRVLGTSWHTSGSDIGLQNWRLFTEAYWCYPVPAFHKYLGLCTATDPTPPVAISEYVPWQSDTFYNVTGPTTVCCEETDQKFVVYGAGATIALDNICNTTEELVSSIDIDTDVFRGVLNAAGVPRTIELPSAVDPLFSSGLYDDLGACSLLNTDPFWFGAWLDAFTGTGWIKHEGYHATDPIYIGPALQTYPMLADLPISSEFSGWFGTPFPRLMK